MKKALVLLLFISFNAVSQNLTIMQKDGTTIVAADNSFDDETQERRIAYKLPGDKWNKYIDYKDLDFALFGNSKFKSFKIDGKKPTGYFVLAESKEKSLLGIVSLHDVGGDSYYQYTMCVLDAGEKLLDKVVFTRSNSDNKTELRGAIPGLIKKHFSDWKKVMDRLAEYESDDEKNLKITGFFDLPVYINCN